jgi:hypothetical protein
MSLGTNIPLYGANKHGSALGHASHGVKLLDSDITLTEDDCGSSLVIIANGGITVKLPAPVKGMCFDFFFGGNAAETEDVIIDTQSDTYFLNGALSIHDTDATNAVALAPIYPNGSSNSKMTLKDPGGGTWMKMVSDGVVWYCVGLIATVTATAVVYADQ